MVELRVKNVDATMYIQGSIDRLPRNAPIAAMIILIATSFLASNLSENNPDGTVNRN